VKISSALFAIGILSSSVAFAQSNTSATATQNSAATSTAQGTIEFSQTPEHTSQTVNNVASPVLGSYASSFSQMNCGQTTQVGGAIAGGTLVFGTSKDSHSCVLEVAAAETDRQATIDPDNAVNLKKAAINMRCQINKEVYEAYMASGIACALKPEEMHSRTDDQPANYRVGG